MVLEKWNYRVDDAFIDSIISYFDRPDCTKLGDLNLLQYAKSIFTNEGVCENGIYIFKFEDNSFYVGKATSCTILERLAKHIDSRDAGGFNSLLKKIQETPKASHYRQNQLYMLNSKLLIIPIYTAHLTDVNSGADPGLAVSHLEMDLIIQLENRGMKLQNKSKSKKLSNSYWKN